MDDRISLGRRSVRFTGSSCLQNREVVGVCLRLEVFEFLYVFVRSSRDIARIMSALSGWKMNEGHRCSKTHLKTDCCWAVLEKKTFVCQLAAKSYKLTWWLRNRRTCGPQSAAQEGRQS